VNSRILTGGTRDDAAPAVAPAWIERKRSLSRRDFVAGYLRARRPVVLTEALADWTALKTFTPEFFRSAFADAPVQVRGRSCRLGDVIDAQLASSSERPAPYPCTLSRCGAWLRQLTPRPDCSLPSRHANPLLPQSVFELVNHLEIFFGGPGGEFPYLHYDMLRMHAWIAQVHGEKEFTLYERGQEHLLYINDKLPWLSTVQDARDHDRYPLLRQARSHKVVLRPGELLFIPCGTWHTARCLGMNITVAFDQLEGSNWHEFVGDVVTEQRRHGRRLRALALGFYLRLLGPILAFAELFGANRRADWGAEQTAGSAASMEQAGARC
jgi:Cupin-like domain